MYFFIHKETIILSIYFVIFLILTSCSTENTRVIASNSAKNNSRTIDIKMAKTDRN